MYDKWDSIDSPQGTFAAAESVGDARLPALTRESSAPLQELNSGNEIDRLASNYARLARGLDFVKGIYVDLTDGLTIYTVYEGGFRDATDALYDIYDRVTDMFPDQLTKYRLISAASDSDHSLPSNARRVA